MRLFLGFLLACTIGTVLTAQTRPGSPAPTAPPAVQPATPALESDARQVREQLREVLLKYPPDLGRILKMDPTMMTNQQYLAQYPALAQFLAAHPEIVRNPGFYLEFVHVSDDYTRPPMDKSDRSYQMWRGFVGGASVFSVTVFLSAMIAWLVRTFLNHRKWLRTSKVQTEVHNKLLDRFAGTNELMTYMQTSAGRRFLEAAPIPVEGPVDRAVAPPLNRILWSVQAGIVLVIGGLGFQYVSSNIGDEVAEGVWTIGVLAMAFGTGFVVAGVFSYVMSRRLGLLDPIGPHAPDGHGDSTVV